MSKALERVLQYPIAEVMSIDKHDLDSAWELQTQVVWNVNEALVEANAARDQAKAAADRKEAVVFVELSAPPPGGGRSMAVERAKLEASTHPDVLEAWDSYYACKVWAEELQGLLSSLSVRQSALKHLSELYEAGYFVSDNSKRKESRGVVARHVEERRASRRREAL